MLAAISTITSRPMTGANYCAQCVCMSVCVSLRSYTRISKTTFPNFVKFIDDTLSAALSPSDNNAIRYVLPVLWMTSRFHREHTNK